MNRIRKQFAAQLERLYPVLHETYRRVGVFQNSRTPHNAQRLLEQLRAVAPLLAFFRPHVPRPKQPYFAALANASLDISDRIVALDVAVGAMHIEFAVERAYMHQESQRLREVLEGCRRHDRDEVGVPEDPAALATGLPAAPGVAVGPAFLMSADSDYRRVPAGAIVVARMTRPELIECLHAAAGIVTDLGGMLCHSAIIARELRIPCVVGTGFATQRIRPAWTIRVHGSTGRVSRVQDNGDEDEP